MKYYERVKELLENNSTLRDNDLYLWYELINQSGFNMVANNTHAFFVAMYEGKLPLFDTVTRVRRKVQEDHEHLRGKNYKGRQAKQDKVKKELAYMSNGSC